MRHLKQFVSGLALVLAVSFAAIPVVGDDKDDDERIDAEELVEALVNPGKPYHVSPQDYDLEAQKRIIEAWGKLSRHATEAFPTLVRHLDDERYCISCHISGKDEYPPMTVGRVCGVILAGAIECAYRSHIRGIGDGGPETYFRFSYSRMATSNFKNKDWREKFKKKPLFKMQIAAVKWAIEKVSEFKTVDEEKKADVIKNLKAQLKELKKSRTPIEVQGHGGIRDVYNFPSEASINKFLRTRKPTSGTP